MHLQRSPWGVLAWDVAGMGITYMCLQALAYLCMVLVVEYSLAAEVRAKLDQWRLRMGGWTNRDLDGMLAESRGQSEDADVRAERTRVSAALAAGAEACAGEPGRVDTILIQALAKVGCWFQQWEGTCGLLLRFVFGSGYFIWRVRV